MIVVTQGDVSRLLVPVKRLDNDEWLKQIDYDRIRYAITTREGAGETVYSITDESENISVDVAGEFDNYKFAEERIPDDAAVVVIRIPSEVTYDLDIDFYFQEIQIDFTESGDRTVRGPERIQVNKSAT